MSNDEVAKTADDLIARMTFIQREEIALKLLASSPHWPDVDPEKAGDSPAACRALMVKSMDSTFLALHHLETLLARHGFRPAVASITMAGSSTGTRGRPRA